MGISRGETIAKDPLSAMTADAVTWGVGICCSHCAGPVVPVKCPLAKVVKLIERATTRSASRCSNQDPDLWNPSIESERSNTPGSLGSRPLLSANCVVLQ